MKVEISAEAERDLQSISEHIALGNPARALSLLRELRSKCPGLTDLPNGSSLVRRYKHAGIRRCLQGNDLISIAPKRSIVVLHMLHGGMDYTQILLADGDDLN